MIAENSAKIYRFKLDHNLGYGFAEVYDFTDYSSFDGCVVYTYNKLETIDKKDYSLSKITKTGISLGPIRMPKFPSTRGLHAWRFLFKNDNFLITKLPIDKDFRGLLWKEDNWDNLKGWYSFDSNTQIHGPLVDYSEIRHLETSILNSSSGIVTKFSMKAIIDNNEKVSDYYDLSDLGTKNMFVQMINTYYPLNKTIELLRQLPRHHE